jgi:ligand-binding sensor domain-containing protein
VYLRLILSLSFLIGLFIFTDGPARGAQETPAPGGWRTYTNTNCIFDLAIWGDEVWAATCGGVVRWNRTDGSYIVYTVADGLPHNNIAVIAVDPQGHIWAAPNQSDMLTVFDGQAWTVYTAAAGLPGGSINAIVVDQAGYIWLGGGSGQLSKSVGSVLNGAGPHPRPLSWNVAATLDYPIYSLAIDSGGRVWAGTYEGGVTLIDGQSQTTYTVANGLPDNFINDIALDPAGRVWLATAAGVTFFDGQSWTGYTAANGLADNYANSVTVDAQGRAWFGTAAGLTLFDGQSWTSFTPANGLPVNDINAVVMSDDGHIWAGGKGGLSEFDGQTWHTYATDNGLGNIGQAAAIAFDQGGRTWFGDPYGGVSVFDGQIVTRYTSAAGLVEGGINAIVVDPLGQIWVGSDDGLSRFDGQTWTSYTTADGLAAPQVNAMVVDVDGRLWLGTTGGVSFFDDQRWQTYTAADGLGNNHITALILDPGGRLWAGTADGGLSVFDGQSWRTYSSADGLVGNTIHALAVDGSGRIWAGTYDGVSVFDGQGWTGYTSADGLANNWVSAIAVDLEGRLWFATWGGGVSRFDGQTWTSYTTADGLAYNHVQTLAVDGMGRVWAGTDFGVSVFEERRLLGLTGLRFSPELEAELLAQGYIIQTQAYRQGETIYRASIYQPAGYLDSTSAPNYLLVYKVEGSQSKLLYELWEEVRFEFYGGESQDAPVAGWLDMNGDGLLELTYRTANGGTCWGCAQLHVLQLRAGDQIIDLTQAVPPEDRLGSSFILRSLLDVDEDGTLEWEVFDTRWEFAFGLCHACSPVAERIYAWDGVAYRNASAQFPEYYGPRLDQALADVEQMARSDVPWTDLELGRMISLILGYENAGRGQEGWAIFERYADPDLYSGRAEERLIRALLEARELFRTWYEPDPTPATDYDLVLSEPTLYRDAAGYIHVVGNITNDDEPPLEVVLAAGLYADDGTVLDADTTALPFTVLEPGETLPYDFSTFSLIDNIESQTDRAVQTRVRVAWAFPTNAKAVALATHPAPPEPAGLVWQFKGEVINRSGQPLDGAATISVALYDTRQNPVAAGSAIVYGAEITRIAPEEAIPYQVIIKLPPTLDPTSLTVKTYAQGLDPS